ncbi:retrotransposon protein, putative, ty3-gypsy subclass [Tanacetum coccineum]|uniref:Retrotransposon protein, putative, ty3-gypsy subclass n=1 Tax=Tanacetum coccineum TaxID=301880 RepID=A0ABQ4ZYY4_9ASTR
MKVRGNDIPAYTECFQELTLICTKFVANETEKIDKYLSGLPDNIYGNVKAAKPKTLDEIIELASDLMDRKLLTYAERQSDNKRRVMTHLETKPKITTHNLQRQMSPKFYNMGTAKGKPYIGSRPIATMHPPPTRPCNPEGNAGKLQGKTVDDCGASGHFKRDCPKLKKDGGNRNLKEGLWQLNAEKRKSPGT